MRRNLLLITLLMALFAPLAMNAQSTLTVNDGTTTNEYVPFYGYYADEAQQDQMIFPATVLREMAGNAIFEMTFSCSSISSANSGGLGNWIVSLGETTATTLSALDNTTALTQVFSGEFTVNASAKQVIVTFDSPYVYNGGNLLVEFNHPNPTGYRRIVFYGVAATGAAYTYSAVRNFLPKTTFSYLPADYCFAPTNVAADALPNAANISWVSDADTWNLRYRINAASEAEVLLSTDFESGLPRGWNTIDSDGDGFNWVVSTDEGNFNCNSGEVCMVSASYDADNSAALTPDNWLVTTQVELGGMVSLYARGQDASWCGEHFAIYVSTESNTDVRTFTQVSEEFVATGAYKEYTADLSGYERQNGYIAIRHYNITDMFYLNIDDVTVYGPVKENEWTVVNEITDNPYSITGLTPETSYQVEVQAVCSRDNTSDWTETLNFTTPSPCTTPFDVEVSDITYNSAIVNWDGYVDNYNIKLTKMDLLLSNDFDGGMPSDWTTIDNDGNGDSWSAVTYSGTNLMGYSECYNDEVGFLDVDDWLITPQVELGGTFSFIAAGYLSAASYSHNNFAVYVSTESNTDLRSFEQVSDDFVSSNTFQEFVTDLSAYEGQTGYIAIRHLMESNSSAVYLLIDEIKLMGSDVVETTIDNVTAPYTLDLEEETYYSIEVQGICSDGTTDWSEAVTFTTLAGNVFITDGDWNVAANWKNNVVPEDEADIVIKANCIIPADYVAIAGSITILDGGTLTIKDGGQLIHTNEGVVATMEKEITGYTGEKDHYYLISTPVMNELYHQYDYDLMFPDEVENMLTGEYDLYGFDCTEDLEWLNYEADAENFVMWQGMGYLYANSADVTLSFTGELLPFESTYANNWSFLTYEASDEAFTGFNLVGNMFAADAYIVIADYESGTGITGLPDDVYFYTMGDGELVPGTGAVAPMEGVFVQASSDSQVALCYTQALRSNSALNMTLSQNGKQVDAAYIRFNEGSELNKIQLNPNHTKLFFNKNNEDFAVVRAEAQGEMPVSFKAENNGTYTLSFSNENVEFSYLHLIDNLTGNDVDLLANPSYSFEAKTTDYASRFRLVFAQGNANSSDDFAFFNNGNLVINNEGNALMNVYDVTGRLINSQSINGSCQVNFNASTGVYMIQLVNDGNTKTQKIVVK